MKLRSHWWWDLSAEDFRRLDMSRIVAVLPVGAVEQHGPHLPVRVDTAIVDGILQHAVARMADDFPALILPTMSIGKSNEHSAFPGTLTLSAETLGRVWYEVCESIHRAGVRKVVFVNSHGGQPQVMEIVCRELRVRLGMLAVSSQWSRFTDMSDLFTAAERKHGIHGGEIETSAMLYLHPDLVDMALAEDFRSLSQTLETECEMLMPESSSVGFGWQMQDINPKGACGNAALADGERGHTAIERAASRLIKLISEVDEYPLSRIRPTADFTPSITG
ncbi:creatininase family protein [Bradyrhizobium sp. CSA207]|uniref:creatininase family protein n=1 Tax=Bradyrhizobium sp. CSA207 TaxID=2698826 RepID=UPI0023B12739|nr:creatininase family protein [Bradyrhizobium sp. CSA207]MDE5442441.1 creatininase family protein [Bradyrhizobium sp. CSA207]